MRAKVESLQVRVEVGGFLMTHTEEGFANEDRGFMADNNGVVSGGGRAAGCNMHVSMWYTMYN